MEERTSMSPNMNACQGIACSHPNQTHTGWMCLVSALRASPGLVQRPWQWGCATTKACESWALQTMRWAQKGGWLRECGWFGLEQMEWGWMYGRMDGVLPLLHEKLSSLAASSEPFMHVNGWACMVMSPTCSSKCNMQHKLHHTLSSLSSGQIVLRLLSMR
eukprot:1148000-Pelagomonas_calceolata.AAC.1